MGKHAEAKKEAKKDAQRRQASGKVAKDKEPEKSQASTLNERGPDLSTLPKTTEVAQAFMADNNMAAKSSATNQLSIGSSDAASASLRGSKSPATLQKQSVISN